MNLEQAKRVIAKQDAELVDLKRDLKSRDMIILDLKDCVNFLKRKANK